MIAARKNLTAALLLAITVAMAMTFVAAAPPGLSSLGRSAMDCPIPMSMSRNDKCDPRDVNTWSQELRTGLTRFYGNALKAKKIDGEQWLEENPTDEDKACKVLFGPNNCQREMHNYFKRMGASSTSALVQKRGLGHGYEQGSKIGSKCTEEQRKMCQAQTCTKGSGFHKRGQDAEHIAPEWTKDLEDLPDDERCECWTTFTHWFFSHCAKMVSRGFRLCEDCCKWCFG